ncbi:hypothetical protein OQY15_00870 [Pedobacter sp. MC2016-15]|uniref:hypothetical protein n=1 Tax=Pedobacter sp. MC2016-15 TaxID=2994473 RepID=UPI0022469875|nr:hypothetical protein [Pedobacter sp. MC2016-15]MCX2477619.1 hypothetical protein [Pedobacter sp. MC2016-15]
MKTFRRIRSLFKALIGRRKPRLENIIDPFTAAPSAVHPSTVPPVHHSQPVVPERPISNGSDSSNYLGGLLNDYHTTADPAAGPSSKPEGTATAGDAKLSSRFSFDSNDARSSSRSSENSSSSGGAVNLSHFPAVPTSGPPSIPPMPGPPPSIPLPPIPSGVPGLKYAGPRKGKVTTGVSKAIKPIKKLPGGLLKLTKLKFDTKFDVCSDVVEGDADYKRFYILNDGDYYHWLLERTDPQDLDKPEFLPLAISGDKTLRLTATFKVDEGKTLSGNPLIRIEPAENLTFKFSAEYGQTSGEFEITFRASNTPYQELVGYIEHLELKFEYFLPEQSEYQWAGTSTNEVYITWKEPLVLTHFERDPDDLYCKESMLIKCLRTGGKYYIPESILFLGCSKAAGRGNALNSSDQNEWDIISNIFAAFTNLMLRRKRDPLSAGIYLGYWRGKFRVDSVPPFRGARALLRYGEGRCGEWEGLLSHIIYAQGIDSINPLAIVTEMQASAYSPISSDPYSKTYKVSGTSFTGHDWDINVTDVKNELVSSGTGTRVLRGRKYTFPDAFLPPSALLYDEFRTCVFLVKNWRINDPMPPQPLDSRAQGNDRPLSLFWDHVFTEFEYNDGTKTYFDPSYGISSDFTFDSDRDLLTDYSENAFSGVLQAAPVKDGAHGLFDNLHSDKYINLFERNVHEGPGAPPGYQYNTVTGDQMVDFILRT